MKAASLILLIVLGVAVVVYIVGQIRNKSGPAGGPEHGVPVEDGRGKT